MLKEILFFTAATSSVVGLSKMNATSELFFDYNLPRQNSYNSYYQQDNGDVEPDFVAREGGPVWQQLREAAGGSMYVGDVLFGNAIIPSVMDTGSISIIALTCKCPRCRGYTQTIYSQCDTDEHSSRCTPMSQCDSPSSSYKQLDYQMKISYVSGTTVAKEASESIGITGMHEDGSPALLKSRDMTFYEITQNHLDIIKRDFFGAVVGVAPGCGGYECFQKHSKKCPYDSCQSSFLHKAAGGTRYSFCLERFGETKPGWFIWNDVNRDNDPGAVKLQPLMRGSSGGDDALLWYTDVTKLRLSGKGLRSEHHLGVQCTRSSPCHSVWDSGTTLLALPSSFASVLEKNVAQIIREKQIKNPCNPQSHVFLPTIELDVPREDQNGVFTLKFEPWTYMWRVDGSSFFQELLREPELRLSPDQRARLAWFLHNSNSYDGISQSDIKFLKCFLHNNCHQNGMSLKRDTGSTNSTNRLGAIFRNLGSQHACGVQVMRTGEEVPEFILGVPAFRKYFVNFHMPTPQQAQNEAFNREDYIFSMKKTSSSWSRQHKKPNYFDKLQTVARSEVQDRGNTVIEPAGDCGVEGKPGYRSTASSLMSKTLTAQELEAEEAKAEPLLLSAMMFPKRRVILPD
eukprot:gene652-578_t